MNTGTIIIYNYTGDKLVVDASNTNIYGSNAPTPSVAFTVNPINGTVVPYTYSYNAYSPLDTFYFKTKNAHGEYSYNSLSYYFGQVPSTPVWETYNYVFYIGVDGKLMNGSTVVDATPVELAQNQYGGYLYLTSYTSEYKKPPSDVVTSDSGFTFSILFIIIMIILGFIVGMIVRGFIKIK